MFTIDSSSSYISILRLFFTFCSVQFTQVLGKYKFYFLKSVEPKILEKNLMTVKLLPHFSTVLYFLITMKITMQHD